MALAVLIANIQLGGAAPFLSTAIGAGIGAWIPCGLRIAGKEKPSTAGFIRRRSIGSTF
jgi:hypothetical protein